MSEDDNSKSVDWILWLPEWLEIRIRIWQVKRVLRSLERHYRARLRNAANDQSKTDNIYGEWAHEAEWPEGDLAVLESRRARRIATRLHLRVPNSEQDPFTGHWRIPKGAFLDLKREIEKEKRARVAWWIQIFVMPSIGLLGAAAAVLALLRR